MAAIARANAPDSDRRVRPDLRELIALARAAGTLPSWSRAIRARSSGPFLSTVRGRGMEYDESRPYQPGDDIRQLDWRVTARSGRPHTKLFREERERPVLLVVDCRQAMAFATRGVFKCVQAARVAALLAWRAQQNGDRVGALVFDDQGCHELAPRRGKSAALACLKLLVESAPTLDRGQPRGDALTSLASAFERLQRIAKPGSLVFIISDFRGFDRTPAATLAHLAAHADIGLVAVHDRLEAEFPALDSAAALTDGARSVHLLATADSARAAYAERFKARLAAVRQACREQRALSAVLDCESDALAALSRMLGR